MSIFRIWVFPFVPVFIDNFHIAWNTISTMLKMYLVGSLISNPKIKAKMGNAMNEGMLMPYKKLFEQEKK